MAIRIKVEKRVKRGEMVYVVKEIEALREDELPYKYLAGFPYCYLNEHGVLRIQSGESLYYIEIGEVYGKDSFEELIELLRQCGKRLKEINNEIRKLKKGWHGYIEFII